MKYLKSKTKQKFFGLIFLMLLLAHQGMGQDKQAITSADYANEQVEMADVMRSNGKIYIVVATVCSLLGGLLIYLVTLDRKIGRIEKQLTTNQNSKSHK